MCVTSKIGDLGLDLKEMAKCRSLPCQAAYSFLVVLLLPILARADECVPWTWQAKRDLGYTTLIATGIDAQITSSTQKRAAPVTGEINCRYWGVTSSQVNYHLCNDMAEFYDVDLELLFTLNPTMDSKCSNILPITEYCVDGCRSPIHDASDYLNLDRRQY